MDEIGSPEHRNPFVIKGKVVILARELGPKGINVNAVVPGGVAHGNSSSQARRSPPRRKPRPSSMVFAPEPLSGDLERRKTLRMFVYFWPPVRLTTLRGRP